MGPFWFWIILPHVIFRAYQNGTLILGTTHVLPAEFTLLPHLRTPGGLVSGIFAGLAAAGLSGTVVGVVAHKDASEARDIL